MPDRPTVARASNAREVRHAKWLFLLLLPVFIAAACYLVTHDAPPHGQDCVIYGLSKVALFILSPFTVLLSFAVLLVSGTWIADADGIEFVPVVSRLRKRRRLRWTGVHRVKWTRVHATLCGEGVSIAIPLSNLPAAEREAMQAAIKQALEPDFDLSHRPPRPPPTVRERFASVLRVNGLSGFVAGLMLIAYFAMPAEWSRDVRMGIFMSVTLIPYALAFRIIYRDSHQPDYPLRWRTRAQPHG